MTPQPATVSDPSACSAARPAGEVRAEDLSAAMLIDLVLATHHAFAHESLERMATLAATVAAACADRDPRLGELQDTVTLLKHEFTMHMLREERVLFPIVRDIEAAPENSDAEVGAMLGPLVCMKREHAFLDEVFDKCRELTDGFRPPPFAGADWQELVRLIEALEADTREHVRKEEQILFPRAMEMAPPVR